MASNSGQTARCRFSYSFSCPAFTVMTKALRSRCFRPISSDPDLVDGFSDEIAIWAYIRSKRAARTTTSSVYCPSLTLSIFSLHETELHIEECELRNVTHS